MNSTSKVSIYVSDEAAPAAIADFTKVPSGTSLTVNDAKSTTVSEHIGEAFAAAETHARTVSFAMTYQPGATDGISTILKTGYENGTPITIGIKGSVNHEGTWKVKVADFPVSLATAAVEEITVNLLHTGDAPGTFPTV